MGDVMQCYAVLKATLLRGKILRRNVCTAVANPVSRKEIDSYSQLEYSWISWSIVKLSSTRKKLDI